MGRIRTWRHTWLSARLCAILGLVVVSAALASCGASQTSRIQRPAQISPTAILDPIGVRIEGTQFYSQGRPITLVGVNRPSLEYSCAGDGHLTLTDFQAMRAWGINAVRIPISSEFWANSGAACPGYHDNVRKAVANARAMRLFVILDLQWSAPFDLPADRTRGGVQCPMPDTGKDLAMWKDIAQLYKSDTGVLFDLYGEPFKVSWSTWLNGGTISSGCYVIGGPSLVLESGVYQAIGMRSLVTQIRTIAPDNVIIVSGIEWGYDLAGLRSGFALPDKNLAYGTHPFDHSNKLPSDWNRAFGALSATYPVIAAEFGAYDCGTQYIEQAINYFAAHHMSWLAWSWQPGSCSGPSLLTDWPSTPSAPYGSYLKQRMLAATTAPA